MKPYERWLTRGPDPPDPRRCPVCGHRSLPPVRRQMNRVLLMLLGVALAYIALDVVADGHLDGSLYRAIRAHIAESRSHQAIEGAPPRRSP